MGRSKGTRYTLEFKKQAVALAQRMGQNQAAKELGVNEASLKRWKEKIQPSSALPDAESPEQKIRRLEKENDDLKKANMILRKAAAFFSQDQLK